ncbi:MULTISPECIES: alpha-L-fucosidase [unclassified Streptomyces]|uniref:alpha-L-fucosidase n=1 Tax=unclassified Streptomyces TaxID=2593676 RepID=UPI0022516218|nr:MULTISPECIES: alpha-L-fucosidase [unclassified Streptomyces]MCX4641220.1 alpha-L-fucosidase [Streptomyces sp. NBC_01446]MCX5322363.1 alpha-L-fucosidase [Streptomyces sp. NBC_00120]
MQPWFTDGKLGIFLHWGIYSVDGVAESWSFFNGQVPYDTYMAQLDGFDAQKWDPDAWADLFVEAGAAYAVLTAKHHDGVALWDTQAGDLSVVKRTPAARDLITPYVDALRRRGLKVGLYYSHLDWSHPDYATVRPDGQDPDDRGNPYAMPAVGEESPERWDAFLAFHRAQVRELLGLFQPDLLWFDGEWERSPEQWGMAELAELIAELSPHTVVNGRLTGHGDYATPEQGVPVEPPKGPWELCLTVNDSWGYQPQDDHHKSPRQLVRVFAETVGGGGNLLLAVGPKADGTIPPEQAERLEALGEWIAGHRPAVRDTGRGLPHGHFYGPSTLSADRRTLYLFLFDRPNEYVVLRGVRNAVRSARVLGTGTDVRHERVGGLGEVPGWEYLYVHDDQLDPLCTVVALELDGELDLYREHTRD